MAQEAHHHMHVLPASCLSKRFQQSLKSLMLPPFHATTIFEREAWQEGRQWGWHAL